MTSLKQKNTEHSKYDAKYSFGKRMNLITIFITTLNNYLGE